MKKDKAKILVIGYGNIGSIIVEKLLSNNLQVALFDKEYITRPTNSKNLQVLYSKKTFLELLKSVPIIFLCLPSGKPTNMVFNQIQKISLNSPIVIDFGNSHFSNTDKIIIESEKKNIKFLGIGISGGIQAYKYGFALMVSGNYSAWKKTRSILKCLSAEYRKKNSLDYFGKESQGHFIKMIHNAIEYAYMQLITETINLLIQNLNLSLEIIQTIIQKKFSTDSFLIDITSKIILSKSKNFDEYLFNTANNQTKDNGMGRWAVELATLHGVSIPTITYSLMQRFLSNQPGYKYFKAPKQTKNDFNSELINIIFYGLEFCFFIAVVQGFSLMDISEKLYNKKIEYSKVLNVWQRGTILKSKLIDNLIKERKINSKNIMRISLFQKRNIDKYRKYILEGNHKTSHITSIISALSYFDCLSTHSLPTQLLQMQRFYFGGHKLSEK